ncbi:kynurenine 3-monooxygenase-like [Scylla paramamosain]|uniref:kynurenine 3-monooxygenase-like n=1 Tax=Scylla paramamosain TaxID=85552 RepID=UPI0030839467
MAPKKAKTVAVVGAGLVGTLEACMMAKRGYEVHLYEYRQDIRQMEHVPGRSINLAMSVRGRTGLGAVGVEEQIVQRHGIAMKARMIHSLDGTTKSIPYNREGKCIFSVGRRFVNEVLLTRAEDFPNVTIHFNHKLEACDLERGEMTFTNTATGERVSTRADLMIGCDGAYSNVRKQMLKRAHFNYKQEYIPHGYMELCIPATPDGEFAMPPNYLHIWPRGNYMMIALPNQDRSWTVTLFMPFEIFGTLTTPEELLSFFQTNYPDAIPLIGREKLINDFFSNKPLPMISVKCSPYHVGNTSVIMGDAAHAMVPFYGQGMNCGMEDCVVLNEILDQYGDDLTKALPAYSKRRNPDAEAIVDLAMYNYVEMRDLVNSPFFLLRKKLDDFLSIILPGRWQPLYTMVTFSRRPYSSCIANKTWQDKVIMRVSRVAGVACVAALARVALQAVREPAAQQAGRDALMWVSQAASRAWQG